MAFFEFGENVSSIPSINKSSTKFQIIKLTRWQNWATKGSDDQEKMFNNAPRGANMRGFTETPVLCLGQVRLIYHSVIKWIKRSHYPVGKSGFLRTYWQDVSFLWSIQVNQSCTSTEVRGQLLRVGSFLQPCGSWKQMQAMLNHLTTLSVPKHFLKSSGNKEINEQNLGKASRGNKLKSRIF